MKKNIVQIGIYTLLGLSLLGLWGAEARLSRASEDSSSSHGPAPSLANTITEVKAEKLTRSQLSQSFELNVTTDYIALNSPSQVGVNQISYSDPQNPGHAPGHPRPSALTPFVLSELGGMLVLGVALLVALAFTRRSKQNK